MSDLERRVLLGAAGLAGVAAFAKLADGGPLDPPAGPVSATGPTLADLSGRIARSTSGIAEPRTPLSASTTSVSSPGSYYLTEDLNQGLSILADGVTIDLRGFTVRPQQSGAIIVNIRGSNVTLRNGRITDRPIASNGIGIYIGNPGGGSTVYRNILIEDVDIDTGAACVTCFGGVSPAAQQAIFRRLRLRSDPAYFIAGLLFAGPGCAMIDCTGMGGRWGVTLGERSVVIGCQIANCPLAPGIEVGDGSMVIDSSVDNCAIEGIKTGTGSLISRCSVTRCGTGINAGARTTISDCSVDSCTSCGVRAAERLRMERTTVQSTSAGPGVKVDSFDAAVVDCSINLSAGLGIDLVGPAMIDRCHLANNNAGGIRTDMLTRITACHLDFNSTAGISGTSAATGGIDIRDCTITRHGTGVSLALGTGNAVTRCTFSGNTTAISAPAGVVAPTVSAAGANAATNPLTNLLI